jgi:glycosyltransferase involved in cell wall biosynthesis/SAM-dependent methyltransferase
MKVLTALTYYSPHWTGLTAHAARVAEGLAARGHQVTVLTTRFRTDLPRDEQMNGVRVVRIRPVARLSRGMLTPAFPLAAARLIRQHDVVQIHTPLPEAALVALLCRLLRRPMLMTHHGDLVMPAGAFNQFLQRTGAWITRTAGQLADAVTSYSRDYADHSALLQQFSGKLHTVYPPVEIPKPDAAAAAAWRAELGLTDKLLIGFAGRWVEEKGFDYLLLALPHIRRTFPQAHLIYAGERHVVYEDFYQRCLPLLEAEQEHLSFVGLIHDRQRMADFYSMCDVFALPSRSDMMALVQIESLLCGTPVVASDIPGARVVVQRTGFGKLAPSGDPEGLAEALVAALQQRAALQPDRGRVREVFDPERSLDEYIAILQGIAAAPAAAPAQAGAPAQPAAPALASPELAIHRSPNGTRAWDSLDGRDQGLLDDLLSNEADMAFRRRARILLDYLELQDGDRVIDLGCGMGFYLKAMGRLRRLRLVGLDLELPRLRKAGELQPAARVQANLEWLPFEEGSFDKVLLSEVLEHLVQDEAILRRILRLLKPGGLLAVSVPHAAYPFWWDPINRVITGLGGAPRRTGPLVGIWTNHERLYLPAELAGVIRRAGFEVLRVEEATHHAFPFSHFIVYGLGKPLLEQQLLPEFLARNADRFRGEENSGNPLNPINLGLAAFRAVDGRNERPSVAGKRTFVNVLLKARRPVAG